MIQSIIKLLLIALVLVAIYFAVAMFVTGIWLKLIAAGLVLVLILGVVRVFNVDI